MNVLIVGLSFSLAFLFIFLSNKIRIKWVKRSFSFYSIIFLLVAILVGSIYIYDQRATIKQIITTTQKQKTEEKTEKTKEKVSTEEQPLKESVMLDVKLIEQLPELPRGCEVTSLAMLLDYNGVTVNKMDLAKQIKHDPAPYKKIGNTIHFGNPHNGFVGDMYSFDTPGLGVYHGPIKDLAKQYVGDRVYDFSGSDFKEILYQLNQNRPVWVIINGAYKELPEDAFETWHTKDGPINITMREHSVLIIGYDQEYVYFNDPLNRHMKAPIKDFEKAWIQMGKQAITILSPRRS